MKANKCKQTGGQKQAKRRMAAAYSRSLKSSRSLHERAAAPITADLP